jgi:hypothetical protein
MLSHTVNNVAILRPISSSSVSFSLRECRFSIFYFLLGLMSEKNLFFLLLCFQVSFSIVFLLQTITSYNIGFKYAVNVQYMSVCFTCVCRYVCNNLLFILVSVRLSRTFVFLYEYNKMCQYFLYLQVYMSLTYMLVFLFCLLVCKCFFCFFSK